MNFKNIGDAPPSYGGGGSGGGIGASGSFGLARQPSVISLTFEEFQNSMGGIRKDFGSMNMDEFLKNIWTAEETQTTTTTNTSSFGDGGSQMGGLQRQGSLTLPRTLSHMTVDEVWRDLFKESEGGKDECGTSWASGSNLPPKRQPTLGEMTLEEFLARAGVVREDAQPGGRPESSGIFADLVVGSTNDNGLSLGFGQPDPTNRGMENGVMESRISTLPVPIQPPNLAYNLSGIMSSQAQQPQHQPQPKQQRQLFPKQPSITFAHTQMASQSTRGGIVGIGDPTLKGLVQSVGLESGGMNIIGLGAGGVSIAAASPVKVQSSDGLSKSNGESTPVPFMFSGDLSGRRCGGTVDKVVERRQRRMIKNRESAARSRARKQAITMELEEEVAKLKQQNEELRRKQEEIMNLQKNQILKVMIHQQFAKKRRLRRTLTGPW